MVLYYIILYYTILYDLDCKPEHGKVRGKTAKRETRRASVENKPAAPVTTTANVCMYVCMYVYIYIYVYLSIYLYLYVSLSLYIYIYIYMFGSFGSARLVAATYCVSDNHPGVGVVNSGDRVLRETRVYTGNRAGLRVFGKAAAIWSLQRLAP